MNITPSYRTAALAGAWTAIGMIGFEAVDAANPDSVLGHNLVFFAGSAVFLFVPVFFLVIGRDTGCFSTTWFLDPQERAAYWVVTKTMLVWFASVAVAGSIGALAGSGLGLQ
ncbi:hypothetical protein [Massilia pseudoviolaceinigra]|uniref:hypothetical protein n=1 Tax=Massilia pseudoviolaceinigra TaxID=3057165 RepID=UPI002796998E|nr:hypothetical protein [Massilia sp. CCM 9206]MDQ1919488.1 hypothetical protein [Massilia sp. CCM 9206]